MKIITIGSAIRDIFIQCRTGCAPESQEQLVCFREGEKVKADGFISCVGGGATNSAVSFARLGHTVAAIFKVGNDPDARFILETLSRENVDTRYHCIDQSMPTGNAFVLPTPSGNFPILVAHGANLTLTIDDIPFDRLSDCDALYITPLHDTTSDILFFLTQHAKKEKKFVVVNPGMGQLTTHIEAFKKALPFLDVLMLNEKEAQKCMENISPDAFTIEKFFRTIMDLGPRIIVVTQGSQGVSATDGTTIYQGLTIPTNIISSVGAGDAFCSTFASYIIEKKSFEMAIQAGMINASSVLKHLGAQTGLLSKGELESKMASINIQMHTKQL